MVDRAKKSAQSSAAVEKTLSTRVWLNEVLSVGLRLEASAFGIEARNAVETLKASGLQLVPIYGKDGICNKASKALRFRRVYVDPAYGVPFLSSSDIISMRPEISNYVSKKLTKQLDARIVNKWDVLISRSGTVGNVGLAGDTHRGHALSEDAIRLGAETAERAGYVSAFLRSRYGRPQLTGASYGSVVVHIEASHLAHVLIPHLHPIRLNTIGGLMCEASRLRDDANELLDEADGLLHVRLGLPKLSSLESAKTTFFTRVRARDWGGRLEASFHDSVVRTAIHELHSGQREITTLSDSRITKEVRAITKFRKRVYVPHGGIPLLGGKQLFQVDPVDVKGLAKGAHTKDLPEIALEANMVLVTCSGTIGRTQIIPAYMGGWTANQHATRFIAAKDMNPGYIYAWLASDYGKKLVTRHAYGSVILEVDKEMLGSVPIPIADESTRNAVGDLVLRANRQRDSAWNKEREAISQIEAAILSGDEQSRS